MYLCGHPGTGKTSSLNSILSQMQTDNPDNFKPFLFNAMTYPDVKSFSIILYEKIYESYYGELPKKRIDRDKLDDEDIACKIEMLLIKISEMHTKNINKT